MGLEIGLFTGRWRGSTLSPVSRLSPSAPSSRVPDLFRGGSPTRSRASWPAAERGDCRIYLLGFTIVWVNAGIVRPARPRRALLAAAAALLAVLAAYGQRRCGGRRAHDAAPLFRVGVVKATSVSSVRAIGRSFDESR
jgi:hypothetical protein